MIQKPASVLFADRDLEWSRLAREELRRRGLSVYAARTTREVLDLAVRHVPDVVVLDEGLDELGAEVLVDLLHARSPLSKLVLLVPAGEAQARGHLHAAVCLARPVTPAALLEAVDLAGQPGALPPSSHPLVLCVDDDPVFLRGLSRLLRRHGYDVLPFENPEGALAAAPFVKPDLFILDIRMPGMTGLDLAAELQEREGIRSPLMFLTAAGSDEEISRGYRSGATGYLLKPCDPHRVVDLAEELLEGWSSR